MDNITEQKPESKISKTQLKYLGKLSKLEDKLFKRSVNGKLIRRQTMLIRINHYRRLLDMKEATLKDFLWG